MREGIMNAWLLSVTGGLRSASRERVSENIKTLQTGQPWNPDRFAEEQMRGLVLQVFCSAATPARQVVFSATDRETDVHNICLQAGKILARETSEDIAIVTALEPSLPGAARFAEPPVDSTTDPSQQLRQIATRLQSNLWLLPPLENRADRATAAALHTYLAEIRKQFDYSIVEGSPASESSQSAAIAQFADGIILVISAQHTRRVTARRIRDSLRAPGSRLLGTVLSDREFPMPERIYRRL
jgi:hypothetical protein